MALFNSRDGYGALTKWCHWLIAGLFLLQYLSAAVMLRTAADGTTIGVTQATLFNWHKSLGLVALLVTVVRLMNRRSGELPLWAPGLSQAEQIIIHRAEQLLYAAMLIMPVSGFIYVMAGGFGVRLFGWIDLPNPMGPIPIGAAPLLASVAKWVHVASAFALLLPLGAHLAIVLAHHLGLRDRILDRMLPGRKSGAKSGQKSGTT